MKTFLLIVLILGSFIGAGFCSGREVASYFVSYGNSAYLMAILFGVLFYISLNIFLLCGKNKTQIHTSIICTFATIVITSSMLAGAFNLGGVVLYFVTIAIAIIICYGGIGNVSKFSAVLVPIMLVIILLTCIPSVRQITLFHNNIIYGIPSTINYLFFNMLTMGLFLFSIGKNYTKKQIKIASIISTIIITLLIILMCSAIINRGVGSVSMPILQLANTNNILNVCIKIVVWFALLTTLIDSLHSLMDKSAIYSDNKLLCIVVILSVCASISMLGFVWIVTNLYRVLGVLGIVFCIDVLYCYLKNKR